MTYTCINNYYMFILMFFCGQFFLLPLYLESFSAWLVFLLPLLVSVSQAILSPVIPTPLLTPDKHACWAFACCLLHSGPYFSACLWEVLWITERVTIGTVSANNIPKHNSGKGISLTFSWDLFHRKQSLDKVRNL